MSQAKQECEAEHLFMVKSSSNIALEEFMGGIDITNAIRIDDVSLINQHGFDKQ
jgi:hypothetical protein